MVASTVSSKFLEAMAETEGFRFVETLTGKSQRHQKRTQLESYIGFKFIGNKAKDLEGEGYSVPFGYEEAIGYMIGTAIRDKDGVAATV